MKMFFVIADPGMDVNASIYTGSISHVINLMSAFEKVGIGVIPVFAGRYQSEQKAKKRFASLKAKSSAWVSAVLRDLYKILYNFQFYRRYKILFRKETPNFIYERWSDFQFMAAVIANKMNIPYILEVNALPDDIKWFTQSYFLPLITFIQKKVAEKADAVVVVSHPVKNYLISQGIRAEKIFVIPNAVDVDLFTPDRCDRNIRDKYGIPMDSTVIGFVGSMKRYHGLELFIEAATKVVKRKKKIHFLLVGSFDEENRLSDFLNLLESRGIRKSFILTGGVPFVNVPEYISAMDICVMPHSNQYGSPIKIFEYGAMNKPVVAPRLEPIEEIIKDGENGLLFTPGDVSDMVAKIQVLRSNASLRVRLGSNLQKHVQRNCTWRENAQKILDIYEFTNKRKCNEI